MKRREPFAVDLSGLQVAPAQTWGAVRMVPLLRDEPIRDLRLHPRLYGAERVLRGLCAARPCGQMDGRRSAGGQHRRPVAAS